MKLDVRDEPLLEFAGNAQHVDPRHGIWDYGPIDATSTALRTIRAGIVGTPASVQGLRAWLDRCRLPIAAKDSRLGHLFVPFPGFDASAGFRSTLVWDSRLERHIRAHPAAGRPQAARRRPRRSRAVCRRTRAARRGTRLQRRDHRAAGDPAGSSRG